MPMAPSRQMPMPTTAPQSAAMPMPMPMQASRGRMMNMGGKVAGYKNGGCVMSGRGGKYKGAM